MNDKSLDNIKNDLLNKLVKEEIVTPSQLSKLKRDFPIKNNNLIHMLRDSNEIYEKKLSIFLANYLKLNFVSLSDRKIDKYIINILPEELLRQYKVFPLYIVEKSLILATTNPMDYEVLEKIENIFGGRVEPVVATLSDINITIEKWFGPIYSIKKFIGKMDDPNQNLQIIDDSSVLKESSKLGSITKLAYLIISSAINDKASDIHLESKHKGLTVRYRIDGILHKTMTIPLNLRKQLISSIKILAKMDIVEKRLPLDGSFQVQTDNRIIDLRVSSYPMQYGEKLVLRILDQNTSIFNLTNLGITEKMLPSIKTCIQSNHGLFLVTGSTGSGKTTTLYAILNQIKNIEKNIVTIEDPIEYRIDLINQSEINPKIGLSFAKGLRSILRQDPDVILVGEIRDTETAQIAFQAALTGHLVLATLHTNDAASSLARLVDLGVEPYLISSVLLGTLSQRLVRTTCNSCKKTYTPNEKLLEWANIKNASNLYKGTGCNICRQTGYKGRTGIFELLLIDDQIKKLIKDNSISESDIKNSFDKKTFTSLKDDGVKKTHNNITTLEEVFRVVK